MLSKGYLAHFLVQRQISLKICKLAFRFRSLRVSKRHPGQVRLIVLEGLFSMAKNGRRIRYKG